MTASIKERGRQAMTVKTTSDQEPLENKEEQLNQLKETLKLKEGIKTGSRKTG